MSSSDRPRPITPGQVRAIHAALSRRGIDDGEYRQWLTTRFGTDTCKSLTRRQASDLLATLGRPFPTPQREASDPQAVPEGVTGLPTVAQRSLIAELAGRVTWRDRDGLSRWMTASFGWRRPRTRQDAAQAIEALKAMCRRDGRWTD